MEFSEYLPFWDKLTSEQQQLIKSALEFRAVKKGTRIHDSSAECLGLVMVRAGQLRAYILSEDGREITIRTVVLRKANKELYTPADFLNMTINVEGIVDYYNGEYQIKVFSAKNLEIVE